MTRMELLQEFDEVTHQLLHLLSPLEEEQLNQVPFTGSWTAGQVGDHLYKSYEILPILYGHVEECNRPADQKLPPLKIAFEDFSIKMNAPKEVLPKGGYLKKAELLTALRQRLDQQREALLTTDLTKLCLDFAIPENGHFTRLEWLGFNVIHTRRHLHQLKNIITIVNQHHTINQFKDEKI
ncbi:hypothetical protein IWX76_000191 [Pedobacter sp. CAN_A7]|uniref:DinB family protein n=1 Tax=Pedobacter sp. CAN_A7 TaxID=2787722 RepID=UPI001A282FEA